MCQNASHTSHRALLRTLHSKTPDQCLQISMHWKVLCVDPSSVVCVCIACALDPKPTRVRRVRLCTGHEGVVGWEGKQATVVPCIVILLEQGS